MNPKQFAPDEDFDAYPRTVEKDINLLEEEGGVDYVFIPQVDEMYPEDFVVSVNVDQFDGTREGAARKGFFTGVATVVTKLFNIVLPDEVFFGQKDATQCVVIKYVVYIG